MDDTPSGKEPSKAEVAQEEMEVAPQPFFITLPDIGQTVAANFGTSNPKGKSFLAEITA